MEHCAKFNLFYGVKNSICIKRERKKMKGSEWNIVSCSGCRFCSVCIMKNNGTSFWRTHRSKLNGPNCWMNGKRRERARIWMAEESLEGTIESIRHQQIAQPHCIDLTHRNRHFQHSSIIHNRVITCSNFSIFDKTIIPINIAFKSVSMLTAHIQTKVTM